MSMTNEQKTASRQVNWPGMLFLNIDSGADSLLAGMVGAPSSVSGTDPAPYATAAMQSWQDAFTTGITDPTAAAVADATNTAGAANEPKGSNGSIMDNVRAFGKRGTAVFIGVGLLLIGAYALVVKE